MNHPPLAYRQEATSPLYGGSVVYVPALRIAGEPVLQALLLFVLGQECISRGGQPFPVSWRRQASERVPALTAVLGCSYDELERARVRLFGAAAPFESRRDRENLVWVSFHVERVASWCEAVGLPSAVAEWLQSARPVALPLSRPATPAPPRIGQSPRPGAGDAYSVGEVLNGDPSTDDRYNWSDNRRAYVHECFAARGLPASEVEQFRQFYSRAHVGFADLERCAAQWQPFTSMRAARRGRQTTR